MKVTGAILRLAAVEVLSLFINMTFAGSGSMFIRLICLICTVLILAAVMADYSVKAARTDTKGGRNIRYRQLVCSAVAVTAVPLLSWIILFISANGGRFDFYGAHKLINAPFLHFYNLIEPSASASELGTGELLAMLLPAFAPAAVLSVSYIAAFKTITD
jgi:hypothetical protein